MNLFFVSSLHENKPITTKGYIWEGLKCLVGIALRFLGGFFERGGSVCFPDIK